MKSGFRNLSARTVVEFVNSGFLTRNIRLNSDTFDFSQIYNARRDLSFMQYRTVVPFLKHLVIKNLHISLLYMHSVCETITNICRPTSFMLAMKIFTYLIQANTSTYTLSTNLVNNG